MKTMKLNQIGFSFRLVLCLSFLVFLTPLAITQTTDDGMIISNVHDSSGAAIPNAAVKITSDSTGIEVSATSTSLGSYTSPLLRPGAYTVRIDAAGFESGVSHITIAVHQNVAVDFALKIGSTTQTVNVEAAAPLLDTESSSVGAVQNQQAVANLPLNTRNFNQLISLSTGTVPGNTQVATLPITATRGTVASQVNGIGFRSNNYMVDGIDDSENHNGQGILLYPAVEAIQEFRVATSVPEAEYGDGGASISVVYKSGGNKFHGDVFEFLRNAKYLDAKNFFDPAGPIKPFHYNNYGVTFGGPVILPHVDSIRGKTFFFFSWEGTRKSQSLTDISTVPLTAFQSGNFSAYPYQLYDPLTTVVSSGGSISRQPFTGNQIPTSRFNQTGLNLLKLFPAPNLSGISNNYVSTPAATDTRDNFDFRVDENINDRNNIFARISHQNAALYIPGNLPAPAVGNGQGTTSEYPLWQIASGFTHTFTPRVINEFRAGFTRLNTLALNANYGNDVANQVGIPGVNQPGFILTSGLTTINLAGYASLGDSGYYPAIIADNNFQFNDSVTWLWKKHDFKFGGAFIRRQENLYQTSNLHGTEGFGPIYTTNPSVSGSTGNSIGDMLLGAPASASIAYVPGVIGKRRSDVSAYAQDTWRVSSKLTLNMGLRWDAWPQYPWVEVQNRMAYFVPSLDGVYNVSTPQVPWRSGVQPRYDDFGPRVGAIFALTPKTVIRGGYGLFYSPDMGEDIGFENPPFQGSTAISNTASNFTGAYVVSQGFTRPAGNSFPTLGAALYSIDPHLKTPSASQFNVGVEQSLPSQMLLSLSYVGTLGKSLIQEPNINQATPGPGSVASREPYPLYNSITNVEGSSSSNYNALQATVQKQLVKNLQFLAAYTWSHALDYGGFVAGVQNINDWTDEYGNSDYNIPTRFTVSGIYVLPVGRGRLIGANMSAVADSFLGGWKLSTITNLYSGFPFSVSSSVNTLNGSGAQRANRTGSGVLPAGQRSIRKWFDTSAFSIPAQYQFGNSRRNILRGPSTRMADLSLAKNFALGGEGQRDFELRIDAFNISNTPQFNNPAASAGSTSNGVISSAGSPVTFQRTSRQLQLSGKFHF